MRIHSKIHNFSSFLLMALTACSSFRSPVSLTPVRCSPIDDFEFVPLLKKHARNRMVSFSKKRESWLYSPASDYLAELIYSGALEDVSNFKAFRSASEQLNVAYGDFSISCQGALARDVSLCEPFPGPLLEEAYENYISYFEGTQQELQTQLESFYGISGGFFINQFAGIDCLFVNDPFEKTPLLDSYLYFNGKTKTPSVKCISNFGLEAKEDYRKARFSIGQTEMIVLLPKEESYSFSCEDLFSWEPNRQGTTTIEIPVFSMRDLFCLDLGEDNETFCQNLALDFSEKGLIACAASERFQLENRPSSDFYVQLDRPFYFCVSYFEIPLFCGFLFEL